MKSASQNEERGEPGHRSVGVGGRPESGTVPTEGGGYQDIYSVFAQSVEKKRDARLEELRDVGLSNVWVAIAETVGVDAFLEVWRVLDDQVAQVNPGQREIYVPLFGSYMRFQRNRFIVSLGSQNVPHQEIKKMVKLYLCEDISSRHISRILAKAKLRP